VEPVEVMPHLLVAGGVTLLSGREKTGKSTLVGYLVSQLTRTRGDS
jgi:ABC-type multidrug transport system ATPase subunit